MITKEQLMDIIANSDDGCVLVHCEVGDSLSYIKDVDSIRNIMDVKYWDALIGFEKITEPYIEYEPVFEKEVQIEWDKANDKYYKDKAEFTAKWGCN